MFTTGISRSVDQFMTVDSGLLLSGPVTVYDNFVRRIRSETSKVIVLYQAACALKAFSTAQNHCVLLRFNCHSILFIIIIIIMKFISDKMSIETIKNKEKNPRTRAIDFIVVFLKIFWCTLVRYSY